MRGKRRTKPPADAVFIARTHLPRFATANATYDAASQAFYRVAYLLCPILGSGDDMDYVQFSCTHLPVIPEIGDFYPRYGAKLHLASPDQRAALNDLFNSVQQAIEAAHRLGVEEGRNLLLGMAKGTLTADQAHGLAPIASEESS